MTRYIEFFTEDDGLLARAELLETAAPQTCALVWSLLPVAGYFHHAMYSGPELAMILPDYHPFGLENATSVFLPWELGFASLQAKDFVDVDQDFSEIMFFYDRNTGPRMLDGLVKVNLFGRFVSGHDALTEFARDIRYNGRRKLTVRRAEDAG